MCAPRALLLIVTLHSRATLPVNTGVPTFGTTVGATREVGEPVLASGTHSVWYTWTPTVAGKYVVSLAGSSYDTLLAVYIDRDGTLAGMTLVSRTRVHRVTVWGSRVWLWLRVIVCGCVQCT